MNLSVEVRTTLKFLGILSMWSVREVGSSENKIGLKLKNMSATLLRMSSVEYTAL
jgi:hypothetical protein